MENSMVTMAILICVCITVFNFKVVQASTNDAPEWGVANLKRFCQVFIPFGETTGIPCINFSNDTDSQFYWSLFSPDGQQVLDIGHCKPGRNNCTSPLSPDITVDSFSRGRSVVYFNNYSGGRAWSRLVCTVSQFGHNFSDSCYPSFQQVRGDEPTTVSTTAVTTTETTTATSRSTTPVPTTSAERRRTGNVTFNAHCSFPNMDRIGCHIDSDDPTSSVQWSLITRDGEIRRLGQCEGLRGVCRTEPGANVTLSRRFSWSLATLRNPSAFSGSSILCTASHRGQYRSDICHLDDPTVTVSDCIRGRFECYSRGWQRNTGSINGVAVCCVPRADNLGLSIITRYRDHPCLCPN